MVFTVGLCTGLALAGCTSTPPTITPEPGTQFMTPAAEGEALTVEVLNTELAVGMERLAFRLRDPAGQPIGPESAVNTEFYRLVQGTDEAVLASSGPAQYFGSGTPGGGSWVVYAPFDASGEWGFGITADKPGADQTRGRLNVNVAAHPSAPRVGQMPPSGDSPVGEPAAISSDPSPDPALYARSIAEAMESGIPTLIHFGSPAHCAGDSCVAALDEVKSTLASYKGRANFIHVETRSMTDSETLSPTAQAWGIPSEPWTFVLDRTGRISARAEGLVDRTELGLLLDRELGATP